MLFHASISARHPARVAGVLAEICGGVAAPFPPVGTGSWIALTGDDRGTAFEVYPHGTVLRDGGDETRADARTGEAHSATHMAIGTQRATPQILAIAEREGWPAYCRSRAGLFGVIELWIEGDQLVEILTPQMQHEYRASMTIENWHRFLDSQTISFLSPLNSGDNI